jgi:CRP-like cAMP-binding protein
MILRSVNEIQIADKVTFMCELPLFKNVPYATVQSVAYVLTVRDYPRNAVVVRQGTECEDLFFVESGSVKLVREVEDRGLLRLNGVLALGPGALLQRDAGKGGAGMRVAARFKKGGINAEPPAPPGFREDEAEAPTSSSPDFYYSSSHRGPRSAGGGARAGERGGARQGAMPHINVGDAVPLGSYESAKDTSGSSDWAPLLHSSVDLHKRATTPGASPSLTSPPLRQRRYSGIDTGRLSPHRRDEAAAAAGLGRLFLEVGTHKRYDYFGDTVLMRKTKQAASVITTTSTRCYVLNKWDLLRRVDKSVIEHVQRDRGDQVEAMGNDRALIREFQRSREWMEYKDGLVEDIITRRMKNLGKR